MINETTIQLEDLVKRKLKQSVKVTIEQYGDDQFLAALHSPKDNEQYIFGGGKNIQEALGHLIRRANKYLDELEGETPKKNPDKFKQFLEYFSGLVEK